MRLPAGAPHDLLIAVATAVNGSAVPSPPRLAPGTSRPPVVFLSIAGAPARPGRSKAGDGVAGKEVRAAGGSATGQPGLTGS